MKKEVWTSGDVTLYLGDCRVIVPGLKDVDAIVSDPPYGIGFQRGSGGRGIRPPNRKLCFGDDEPFDPSFLVALAGNEKEGRSARRPLVLLGADHYKERLPGGGSFLCWDKSCGQGPANTFSDAEFAWMNRRNARCIFHHFWMGALRSGEGNQNMRRRLHAQQKPVELMAWLMVTARIGLGKRVLDPFMGSGSTGIACVRTGRAFVGIEIDREHFQVAKLRIRQVQQECGLTP